MPVSYETVILVTARLSCIQVNETHTNRMKTYSVILSVHKVTSKICKMFQLRSDVAMEMK